ncbi:MAG TPA: peptidoglycan DD-metalloendopeptidase family protein [Burkholderiales bacterium]|nr:peptidoglycan DD-metalloendopeptidase family protein [Burkholderiales bacterium]
MKWLILFSLFLAACSSEPNRAPVVERRPVPPASKNFQVGKDWRPQVYVVKNGDTLFGIALEFGLDYRELAEWNGITNINRIVSGRELRLSPPTETAVTRPLEMAAPGEATSPLRTASPVSGQSLAPAPAAAPPASPASSMLKSEPLAVEIPYSDKALAALQPAPPAAVQKPVQQPQPESPAPKDTGGLDWGWPAQGKVVSTFSESANLKGIDIAGKMGEPVIASASGKVVYTGSGLRGYGKLIIIKHNKTFLSAYAHNSQILVKEGQDVKKGEEIGKMGDSDASQVMLHFEIRRFGKPVDPMNYLKSDQHDQGAHS